MPSATTTAVVPLGQWHEWCGVRVRVVENLPEANRLELELTQATRLARRADVRRKIDEARRSGHNT